MLASVLGALRDYKTEPIVWGGDSGCRHKWGNEIPKRGESGWACFDDYRTDGTRRGGEGKMNAGKGGSHGCHCPCGAWRGSLGLEPTIELYLAHMIEVFKAVKRVLRDDGTCFVNLGDSYAGTGKTGGGDQGERYADRMPSATTGKGTWQSPPNGMQPGNLCQMPTRFALAMQSDGWILRSRIIWAKGISFCDSYSGSVMPESVNGWRWEKCKVKVSEATQTTQQSKLHQTSRGGPLPDNIGGVFQGMAEFIDCPGCPKCEPNGGYVLRKGSWRPTSAYEEILMFAKTGSYFCDNESVRETMHEMQGDPSVGAVSSRRQGARRSQDGVPSLRETANIPLEANEGRSDQRASNPQTIQRERTWAGQAGGISTDGGDESSEGEMDSIPRRTSVPSKIPQIGQAKERGRQVCGKPKGSGGSTAKLPDRGGTCQASAERPQEAVSTGELHQHSDGGRVDDDPIDAARQMSLLPQGEDVDDGSRHSDEPGRSSRQREHSGSLPSMQYSKGQQDPDAVLAGRNLRNVWVINPQPFPDAHFATYPEALIKPIIQAATSEKGVCPECGAPWCRVTQTIGCNSYATGKSQAKRDMGLVTALSGAERPSPQITTLGWRPTCGCRHRIIDREVVGGSLDGLKYTTQVIHDPDEKAIPATILDPFLGSGTTALVAKKLGRNCIGIELNADYADMARKRIGDYAPLFSQTG